MYNDDERALIALDALQSLDYNAKCEILNAVSRPKDLLGLGGGALSEIKKRVGEGKANVARLAMSGEFAESQLSKLGERGITALCCFSALYPKRLLNFNEYPLVLYCKGNLRLLESEKCFAVVGSRKTLPNVLAFTVDFSRSVSSRGAVVVTGTADGGDRAAIVGALESGNVISVLAHGHDSIYPQSNRTLIERVAEKGLVISEYPFDVPSRAWQFPRRNRIIAGLGKGVLIVSGAHNSGARHTAEYALEYGAQLFAVPYSLGVKSGELGNHLIKRGAMLLTDAHDVDFLLGLDKEPEPKISLTEEERRAYLAIKGGAEDAAALMRECGLKIFELQPIISALEIKGLIARLQGNKFKATK